MAGARITIEYDDRAVLEVLQRLRARCDDLEPVFADIGEYLLRSHEERMQDELSPEGESCLPAGRHGAPLSPDYAERKAEERPGAGLLVWDEWLRRLHYQVDREGLALGTDRIYGAAMQFGMPQGYAGTTRRGAPTCLPAGRSPGATSPPGPSWGCPMTTALPSS